MGLEPTLSRSPTAVPGASGGKGVGLARRLMIAAADTSADGEPVGSEDVTKREIAVELHCCNVSAARLVAAILLYIIRSSTLQCTH